MDRERLDQQFDFIKEIDKEKFISGRQDYQTTYAGKMTLNMHGIWQS